MKMRKNFALLMVLAVAVFVASAGVASAKTAYTGGSCFCGDDHRSASDKYGASGINSGASCTYFCGSNGHSGVTSNDLGNPQVDISSDQIGELAQGLRGSVEDYCQGETCSMDGEVVSGPEGAFFVPESKHQGSMDIQGQSFSCTSDSMRGQGSAAQVVTGSGSGSGDDECTTNNDCPGPAEECRAGTCVDTSEIDGSGDDSGTASGTDRSAGEQESGGFFSGFFTANN